MNLVVRATLLLAAALAAVLAAAGPAQARCVTFGADGITNVVCDLP